MSLTYRQIIEPPKENSNKEAIMEEVIQQLWEENSPYLGIFNLAKHRTKDEFKAKEIVIKIWLAHLWQFLRSSEGLPSEIKSQTDRDAFQLLKEYDALDRTEFGWDLVP